MVYSLEDVSICTEAGGLSTTVVSHVSFENMAESSHQSLEVTCCYTQRAWREDPRTLGLIVQKVTLRRAEGRKRRTQQTDSTHYHQHAKTKSMGLCIIIFQNRTLCNKDFQLTW